MTQPLNSQLDDDGRRTYSWTGERFLSVTTILDLAIPKYLIPWATKAVAESAYGDVLAYGEGALAFWEQAGRDLLESAQTEGRLKAIKLDKQTPADLALRYLKGASDRIRDAAAGKGSAVHGLAEEYVRSHIQPDGYLSPVLAGEFASLPEGMEPYMVGVVQWNDDFKPRYYAVESTVYNREVGYAGTTDAIVWLGHTPTVVDLKSGNEVYPEAALQLSAYARAEFIGMEDGTEKPLPKLDEAGVLHLLPTPNKAGKLYEYHPIMQPLDRLFDYFKVARATAEFRLNIAPSVIGKPIGGTQ